MNLNIEILQKGNKFWKMKNSVVIKGNKYGIIVLLDDELPYDELKENLAAKFRESSDFFKQASMGITFEGRDLSDSQTDELIKIISDNSKINIVCVIDNDKTREEQFKKSMDEKLNSFSPNDGQFYRGTLRSGQVIESESSIVILGDVNPGAKVISSGNVVILGALKGTVYAGVNGDQSSFVVALEMAPMQIRIGDIIARCSDNSGNNKNKKQKKKAPETKIAFVENDNIYIETLNKEVLSDIRFN